MEKFRKEVAAPITTFGALFGLSKVSGHYREKVYEASDRLQFKETFDRELLSAYHQKFPEDQDVTQYDLEAFKSLAVGTGEFPALDDAHYAWTESLPHLEEIVLALGQYGGGVAAVFAGVIAVFSTLNYGYNKVAGNRYY